MLLGGDHLRFRDGLERRMDRHPRTEVVATAGDGHETLRKIRDVSPRVALVDLQLQAVDGLEIASSVRRDPTLDHVIVVLLTARCDADAVAAARYAGAAACLDKAASRTDLLRAALEIADRGGGPSATAPRTG